MPTLDPPGDGSGGTRDGGRRPGAQSGRRGKSYRPRHTFDEGREPTGNGSPDTRVPGPGPHGAVAKTDPGAEARLPEPAFVHAGESPDAAQPDAGAEMAGGLPSDPEAEAPDFAGNRRRRPGAPLPVVAAAGPQLRRPRRRRRAAAVLLISLAGALILVAVGVGSYPFYTDIQAGRHQKTLKAALDKAGKESGAARLQLLQQYQNRSLAIGSPVTRIIIPKLNVDTIVVEGTSDEALAVGAGHYPQSPLPGEVGNVSIAGHRTMNGHPFGDLDKLAPGDKVVLQTPFGQYNYEIVPSFDAHANPWVTTPTDWTVISFPTQARLLTMTTCNPKGQKTQRLVARAQMVSSQPLA